MEPLLLTLPARVDNDKILGAIKAQYRAPEGCKIVGFDFASEEAQIAGAYASARSGFSGSNLFDKAMCVGDKSTKSDVHSLTAQRTGIPRAIAKNCVYGLA